MADGVKFDSDKNFDPIPEPKLRPPSMADGFLKAGIVSSPGDAAMILGAGAFLLVAASFYMLVSSISPAPKLGSDIPRAGEIVPEYVK